MEKMPQNYANHAKLDPKFHFVLFGILAINFLLTVWRAIMLPFGILDRLWMVVMAGGFILMFFIIRIYPLKVQDRVIRLEERLRMMSILPETLRPRIWDLKESQLVALRFASDAELPDLVEKTLANNLDSKAIKQAIQVWRPDYFRV